VRYFFAITAVDIRKCEVEGNSPLIIERSLVSPERSMNESSAIFSNVLICSGRSPLRAFSRGGRNLILSVGLEITDG
jgi:hypothetical protein